MRSTLPTICTACSPPPIPPERAISLPGLKRALAPALALIALVAQFPAWAASAGERWAAYSKTAEIHHGQCYVLAGTDHLRQLTPAGTIPGFSTVGQRVEASLFRVIAPADPVLLNGNRLARRCRAVRVEAGATRTAPTAGARCWSR